MLLTIPSVSISESGLIWRDFVHNLLGDLRKISSASGKFRQHTAAAGYYGIQYRHGCNEHAHTITQSYTTNIIQKNDLLTFTGVGAHIIHISKRIGEKITRNIQREKWTSSTRYLY